MKKEIWKNVVGYEGLYEVSNFGNVKSLIRKRYIPKTNKIIVVKKEKILNQGIARGYNIVKLQVNKKTKTIGIHRLVAQAFLPNPSNLPQVNHIDGNKQNNKVENLEWCTASENVKHAFKTGLKISKKGKDSKCSKKVYQYNKNMEKIKLWECISDVERELNIDHSTVIRCAKHKQKTAGGYRWEYV